MMCFDHQIISLLMNMPEKKKNNWWDHHQGSRLVWCVWRSPEVYARHRGLSVTVPPNNARPSSPTMLHWRWMWLQRLCLCVFDFFCLCVYLCLCICVFVLVCLEAVLWRAFISIRRWMWLQPKTLQCACIAPPFHQSATLSAAKITAHDQGCIVSQVHKNIHIKS